MATDKVTELLMREAHQEHLTLHEMVESARTALQKCAAGASGQMRSCAANALGVLHGHLSEHFSREERGGWLEEAVVRNPNLAHRITTIVAQHKPLLAQLETLLAETRLEGGALHPIERMQAEFELFVEELLRHEVAEEQALATGFNEDLDLE